jgi:spore maturation protein CgeB
MVRTYNIALMTGSVDFVDYGMGINTLRALNRIGGHKIFHINYKEIYELNGPSEAARVIENELNRNNVDVVIFTLDNNFEFPVEFFSELRRQYFAVMYVGDDEHYFDKSSRYYSQVFDMVITAGQPSVERFKYYGVDAIPALPPFDVRDMGNPTYEKIYDVCFVGALDNKIGRKEYVDHLVRNNIDVKVFGYGTPGGVVSRDEMIRIYGSSRIGLNFAGVFLSNCLDTDLTINRRLKQCTKGRSHEIALTGTFVLAEYAHGVEENFDIGAEVDVFHDKDELLSKIKYYLKNDTQREEMASRAFNKVLRVCDEVNVWKGYIKAIDEKLESKKKKNGFAENIIYKDPIFKRAFASFHLHKMFEFMLSGSLGKALDEFSIYVKYPFFDGGVFLFYVKRSLANIHWLRYIVRKLQG